MFVINHNIIYKFITAQKLHFFNINFFPLFLFDSNWNCPATCLTSLPPFLYIQSLNY